MMESFSIEFPILDMKPVIPQRGKLDRPNYAIKEGTMRGRPKRYTDELVDDTLALVAQPPHAVVSVSALLNIPVQTIRDWLKAFRAMDDSEREAFIRAKRGPSDCMWAALEEVSLVRAMVETLEGNAGDARNSAVVGGISRDKLQGLGQPKLISQEPSLPTVLSGVAQTGKTEAIIKEEPI